MENLDSSKKIAIPLMIVGASSVGKTCILEYFVSGDASRYMGIHLTTVGGSRF